MSSIENLSHAPESTASALPPRVHSFLDRDHNLTAASSSYKYELLREALGETHDWKTEEIIAFAAHLLGPQEDFAVTYDGLTAADRERHFGPSGTALADAAASWAQLPESEWPYAS